MLIYVTGYVQFSIFSSGQHQFTMQTAHGLQQLGHTVKIVNVNDDGATSWEDFNPSEVSIPIIQKSNLSIEKADLLIDCIGCLTGEERQRLASKTVLFIREPPLFNEIEKCVYPTNTIKRSYEGLSEIWTYDLYTNNDCIMLQILGNCPVRTVPFIWSPFIMNYYCQKNNIVPWFIAANAVPDSKIHLMIGESNMNNKSNCTLPLTVWREFSLANPGLIEDVKISNGKHLEDRKFFKDNIFAHVGGGATLEGRSRCVDWTMNPKTILLAHLRFAPIRWLYLDSVWMGIPIVHNCLLLKQLGEELEDFYYPNNSVSGGAEALKKCCDAIGSKDYFTEQRLLRTRHILFNGLGIMRSDTKEKWEVALRQVMSSIHVTEIKQKIPEVYRIQFVGMWDKYVNDYNFFTLLMDNFFKSRGINKKVVGCGSDYKGTDINIRIMGPFGTKDQLLEGVPTIFTTSENIGPLDKKQCDDNFIQLQLGFSKVASNGKTYIRLPLWMMSINWFDADNNRLVNPRLIPLEKCLKPARGHGRSKFCAFIVSNPSNPVRNEVFDLINNRIGKVDSAGRYKNNCGADIFAGPGGGGGEEKKVAFLEDYRFNITYENSYGEGYVTEKMFHAKAAGCVPIYWGDSEAAAADFDPAGFIDARGMTDEELIARIKFLESPEGETERIRIAETPMFSAVRAEETRSYLMKIAEKIADIKHIPKTEQKTNGTTVYGRNY